MTQFKVLSLCCYCQYGEANLIWLKTGMVVRSKKYKQTEGTSVHSFLKMLSDQFQGFFYKWRNLCKNFLKMECFDFGLEQNPQLLSTKQNIQRCVIFLKNASRSCKSLHIQHSYYKSINMALFSLLQCFCFLHHLNYFSRVV